MSRRKSKGALPVRRQALRRKQRSSRSRDRASGDAGFESLVALTALQFARQKIDDVSSVIRAAEDDIRKSRKIER